MTQVKELPALSARERQVVRLIALGNPDKIIAEKIGVALGTVRVYDRRAKEKMGTPDQSSTAALAVALGIVDASEIAAAFGFAYKQTNLSFDEVYDELQVAARERMERAA